MALRGIGRLRAGGGSTAPVAYLGSSYEPVSAGSTLNKTTSWFPSQSLPVASVLQAWECYATATGTVKLKLATPATSGSGWTITDLQTLTCSAVGLNTFSVGAGTLTQQNIPANSLIGFHTPSSGGATISFSSAGAYAGRVGYIAGLGDLAGNNQSMTTAANYGAEIQARAQVTYDRTAVPGDYIINESFGTAGVTPAWAVNNGVSPWSFSVAGQTTSAGTGLGNYLFFYPTSNADRMTLLVEFQFQAAGDRFCIFRRPTLNDANADDGTVIEADLDGNNLIVYQTWGGSSVLPTARTTHAISGLTLATGVRYRLELIYSGKITTAKITRTSDSVSDSVQVDNNASNLSGFCHGTPGFANLAGSTIVKEVKFFSAVIDPKVLIVGDSVTLDTAAATAAENYSSLVVARVGGSGWISSDGGTISLNIMRRIRHEMRLTRPEYVIVQAGPNDANTDAGRDAFIGYMQEIYDLVVSQGATPVVLMVTPNSNATINARIAVMNAALTAKGWRFVRADIATTVGGDGSTFDAAKFADGVHPNATGMAAIDARVALDWPEIFA